VVYLPNVKMCCWHFLKFSIYIVKERSRFQNSTVYRMILFCDKNINVCVCRKRSGRTQHLSLGGWNLHVSFPSLCLYVFCDFFSIMSINYFCSKKKKTLNYQKLFYSDCNAISLYKICKVWKLEKIKDNYVSCST
jgi:hypothetical protein